MSPLTQTSWKLFPSQHFNFLLFQPTELYRFLRVNSQSKLSFRFWWNLTCFNCKNMQHLVQVQHSPVLLHSPLACAIFTSEAESLDVFPSSFVFFLILCHHILQSWIMMGGKSYLSVERIRQPKCLYTYPYNLDVLSLGNIF